MCVCVYVRVCVRAFELLCVCVRLCACFKLVDILHVIIFEPCELLYALMFFSADYAYTQSNPDAFVCLGAEKCLLLPEVEVPD